MELDMMPKNELTAAEKAWEIAKMIGLSANEGGMSYEEMWECFDLKEGDPVCNIYRMPYKEVYKKYVNWMRDRARHLFVGDEVVVRLPNTKPFKMIVTKECDLNNAFFGPAVCGISADGEVHTVDSDTVEKTGKRVNALKYILAVIKEELKMEMEIKWSPTGEMEIEIIKEFNENDMWQFAQRIMLQDYEGGMTVAELKECFGTRSTCDIFRMDYLDARDRYIRWRKRKENEIHVGDEVELKAFDGSCIKMTVTNVTDGILYGISLDGRTHNLPISEVKKTGRRFTDLTDLLKSCASLDAANG